MRWSRMSVLACTSALLLGCRMDNPAFEDDDDELGDDGDADTSTQGESGESETGSSSGSTDTSDEATTENSTLDTSTSSEDTTSDTGETTDTQESETGNACDIGMADCEGECVDLETDELHCGGCGMTCADNQICVGTCKLKKYVFITSEPISGAMEGILGADQFCQELAANAGLPGTYLAWNSTALSFPNFDFDQEGAYVRTDEQLVASSYADLTDGSILVPIAVDESGLGAVLVPPEANCDNVSGAVWSSTTPMGAFTLGPNCLDWLSGNNVASGKIGSATDTDGRWSDVPNCHAPCNATLPIYCVQQTP